jgi:hypothetical protein
MSSVPWREQHNCKLKTPAWSSCRSLSRSASSWGSKGPT